MHTHTGIKAPLKLLLVRFGQQQPLIEERQLPNSGNMRKEEQKSYEPQNSLQCRQIYVSQLNFEIKKMNMAVKNKTCAND